MMWYDIVFTPAFCTVATFYCVLEWIILFGPAPMLRGVPLVGRLCIVGIIHAVLTLALCLSFSGLGAAILSLDYDAVSTVVSSYLSEVSSPPGENLNIVLIHSSAFFLVDCVPNLLLNPGGAAGPAILHHIASFAALGSAAVDHQYQRATLAFLFIMEFANPCMCLNMLLKDMGAVDSWVFAVNEWLFELLFLVDRVIIAPYVTYRWLMLPGEFPAIMLGAMAFVHLFTLLFTPLILRNMWKRMKGERRSDKKKTG